MDIQITIEFPASGATYSRNEYGVYEYGEYPDGSVLAGQVRRSFLDSFPTLDEARTAYPEATESGCGYLDMPVPQTPPAWFDPANAGETWDED